MYLFTTFRRFLLAAAMPLAVALPAGAGPVAPDTATVAEQYLLSAANQERAVRGLQPLHRDAQLARAAAEHAGQMAAHAAISHQFAGEPELTDRGANAGVAFSAISENVAEAPDVIDIHEMWMHSEHHRSNLLDPAIDSAGISVVERDGQLYAVEDFARAVPAVSIEQQEAAVASLVAEHGRIAVTTDPVRLAAARQTCAMSTGFAGPLQPWFIMRFSAASLTAIPDQLESRLASGRFHQAVVGACSLTRPSPFTSYNIAVLLFP
jgi:uncharacterized protein YkwD